MRAWQIQRYGEPSDALALVETDPPELGDGDVLVDVAAAAMGMPDVFMCRDAYAFRPPLPFTPGQEICGTVTAVSGSDRFAVGDRVLGVPSFYLGLGGFAEIALAAADNLYAAPDELDDAAAAGFYIPFQTAWIGLVQRGRMEAGEWVVVLGAAGGSGSAAVQLAAARGARVIAVAGGEEKAAFCRALGAEVVLDHGDGDVTERVREVTGGVGAGIVYDPVGGDVGAAATGCLANEGRFLLVGFAAGAWPALDSGDAVTRNYSIVGVYAGAYDRAFNEAAQGELGALLRDRSLVPADVRKVPFVELPSGLEDLASRRTIGKSVLVVD